MLTGVVDVLRVTAVTQRKAHPAVIHTRGSGNKPVGKDKREIHFSCHLLSSIHTNEPEMADAMSIPKQHLSASAPLQISTNGAKPSLRMPSSSIPIPLSSSMRNGHLNLDVFSPINQNGSFEFDRVLKSGDVYKRSRKTKVPALLPRWIPPNIDQVA